MIRIEQIKLNNKLNGQTFDFSCHIKEGEVVGVISHDRSVREQFMSIISGEEPVVSGEIYYQDELLSLYGQTPDYVGVFIHEMSFIKELSGYKNLWYIAGMNGKSKKEEIEFAMQYVNLNVQNTSPVERYSLRMLQKLGIAQAIMENQSILLLGSEIFTQENENNHAPIKQILRKLKKCGVTILVSTEKKKYLDTLCDYFINLDELCKL